MLSFYLFGVGSDATWVGSQRSHKGKKHHLKMNRAAWDFPDCPVDKTLLLLEEAQVLSLVRELGCQMLHGTAQEIISYTA